MSLAWYEVPAIGELVVSAIQRPLPSTSGPLLLHAIQKSSTFT
ncbi:MAG TPA: hypothetical protein VGJ45_01305 [Pseudonocardiaceae bacterium]|jgi:hypothetical protein